MTGGDIRMTERPKLHLNWPAGERLSEQRKDSGTRDLAATPLVELDSGAELLHSSATSAIERIAGRPIAGIDDGRVVAAPTAIAEGVQRRARSGKLSRPRR